MTPDKLIRLALVLLAVAVAIMLLDGPLKSLVPTCTDHTIGFCVAR